MAGLPPEHKGRPVVVAHTRAEWRDWLAAHHAGGTPVWVTVWKAGVDDGELRYDDLVEEALCFGWIDSLMNPHDDRCFLQMVSPRKPGSPWAASNKARVERLEAAGALAPAGRAVIDGARADGSWTLLDPVDALEVPADLAAAFDAHPAARDTYDGLTVSRRKAVLFQLVTARTEATRSRRLDRAVQALARGEAPW